MRVFRDRDALSVVLAWSWSWSLWLWLLCWMMISSCSGLAVVAAAAPTSLNTSSVAATVRELTGATQWLRSSFTGEGNGAWDETIIQWHESGEYYQALLDYRLITGDTTHDAFVFEQITTASYGPTGDFLGSGAVASLAGTLLGKWNDDIAWWAMAAATGAEIYGTRAVTWPGYESATWFAVADNTLNDMLQQYDSTCGGGIYWSRNRQSDNTGQRYYKSTISNVQAIHICAHLHALNPANATYVTVANRLFDWLDASKLLVTDTDAAGQTMLRVRDGIQATSNTSCAMTVAEYTYNVGVLLDAMLYLHSSTRIQSYMDRALQLFRTLVNGFVDPSTGALYEPICQEFGGNMSCKRPAGYTWSAIRALGHLHSLTTDAAVKASIEKIIKASADVLLKHCDDSFNCMRTFAPGTQYTFPNGTNARDQIEAVFLLNAFATVSGVTTTATNTSAQAHATFSVNIVAPPPSPTTTTRIASFAHTTEVSFFFCVLMALAVM